MLGIFGRDGVFAEAFSLPLGNLRPVPDNVTNEQAVFVEPLAAACQIVQQIHVRPSDRVVVLGAGRLGQLACRVLRLTGARVCAVDPHPERLALLPAGVERRTEPHAEPSVADVVVDCTGRKSGLAHATRLVRPQGTLVLKTTVHDAAPEPPTQWVIDEVTLVGSRCGPFEPALRLLTSGLVDPRSLITERLPLCRAPEALKAARRHQNVKVLIDITLG